MCYQLVELYSACRCLYYQHAIDRCAAYGRPGHGVQKRTILVGYACSMHTQGHSQYASHHTYSDSGYHSSRSSRSSHQYRLVLFWFDDWATYLYSFRGRSVSQTRPPSQLSLLFVGHRNLTMSSSAPPAMR